MSTVLAVGTTITYTAPQNFAVYIIVLLVGMVIGLRMKSR